MAEEHELEMKIKWQDDVFFEVKAKKDAAEWKQIVRIEENGCLQSFWPHISNICKDYLSKQLCDIGEEMGK